MSLTVQDVHKSFSQGLQKVEVLKGLNFQLQSGQVAAILGKSGSGKSTLLSLLAGLELPDQGEIQIDHVSISKLSEEERTGFRGEKIGIVFQQFHLLSHLTALENVCLPLEIRGEKGVQLKEQAESLLAEVGLEKRFSHFPSQLSGGESQRVAIARALIVKPKLLLADEPSGSLDVDTGEVVLDVFFQVVRKHQITTCLVTHSNELAQRCDQQLVLKNGVV